MAETRLGISSIFVTTAKNTSWRPRIPPSIILDWTGPGSNLFVKNYMEKTSIRGVERVTGHRQATISRYYHLIGEHAELLNEFHLQDVQPGRVEMDELWTFIQKKQKL